MVDDVRNYEISSWDDYSTMFGEAHLYVIPVDRAQEESKFQNIFIRK